MEEKQVLLPQQPEQAEQAPRGGRPMRTKAEKYANKAFGLCMSGLIVGAIALPLASWLVLLIALGFVGAILLLGILLYVVLAPAAGVVLGIMALCAEGKTNRSRWKALFAVIAPVAAAVVVILLFSTGALVVRFM